MGSKEVQKSKFLASAFTRRMKLVDSIIKIFPMEKKFPLFGSLKREVFIPFLMIIN